MKDLHNYLSRLCCSCFGFSIVSKREKREFLGYLGVKTCEVFLCFVAIVRVRVCYVTSLFSLFYVTGESYKFLHLGVAVSLGKAHL